jgi:hypothetical protein
MQPLYSTPPQCERISSRNLIIPRSYNSGYITLDSKTFLSICSPTISAYEQELFGPMAIPFFCSQYCPRYVEQLRLRQISKAQLCIQLGLQVHPKSTLMQIDRVRVLNSFRTHPIYTRFVIYGWEHVYYIKANQHVLIRYTYIIKLINYVKHMRSIPSLTLLEIDSTTTLHCVSTKSDKLSVGVPQPDV